MQNSVMPRNITSLVPNVRYLKKVEGITARISTAKISIENTTAERYLSNGKQRLSNTKNAPNVTTSEISVGTISG